MTLYAIRPSQEGDVPDEAEVANTSRYGWQFLEQAVDLWRLVDGVRADEIDRIIDRTSRAAGEGELRFDRVDLEALVRLLSGLEDAIVAAGIVDQSWRVPADQLGTLAKRVPAMNLTAERSLEDKTHALGEVMINAVSIRNFLSNAIDAGCVVVLG
jgi:hypothetical protein